jgi:hypothetical protein
MEKKKAFIKAAAVKPKGNGIKERGVIGVRVYAVVFWPALRYHRTIAAANFAFAFVHWFYKTL